MGALVDEALELTFHGEGYLVTVRTTTEQCLAVDIERREDATVWKGTFAAKYIEEITQRTHNYKSFPVFVHMLVTALRQESDSVFVDLLTYSDLELLKSKRAGQQQQQPPPGGGGAGSNSSSSPANNKRYLILTYAAEFDRVHYPLPLQQEDPDPQRLRDVIKQLRQQLGSQQKRVSGTAQPGLARRQSDCLPELRAVRDENHMLRQQLCKLNTRLQGGMESDVQQLTAEAQETVKDLRQMRKERDTLLLRAQQAEAALEAERNLQRRELRRKVKEQQDMAAELAAAKDQIRELRLKCRELTQELDLAQRRAKVANLSASYLDRARQVGPRPPGRSAAVTPTGSRGVSPAGSRQPSRGGSPAPARRALQPAGLPQRSRSAGPERPSSTPRFDPTEYVRQRRDQQRAAADRMEEIRRQQRLPQLSGRPGSRPASLPSSRPSSMPGSRNSTPACSRMPSRDPSAERGRPVRGGSADSRSAPSGAREGSRERTAVVQSTNRLRGAVATTTTATKGIPSKEQRATSPGRALLEVKARLSQFAGQPQGLDRRGGLGRQQAMISAVPAALAGSPARVQPLRHTDSVDEAEVADIDARLQSLQQFLKAAKAGLPAKAPT